MRIKCAIVDDEPVSRELLLDYIHQSKSLELVGECKNAIDATELIRDKHVDLLFLDINMPEINGIQFYKSLDKPPFVIFTTAYPEFAVEGFELAAIDYLLKPFPYERFFKAVTRAIRIINQNPDNESKYLLFKADRKLYKIDLSSIYHLEAMGDYVRVHYDSKSIMVLDRFQNIIERLPSNQFIRVHKSHAIAISAIELIEGNIIMAKSKEIPIGQSYRKSFFEKIDGNSNE
jgi:DNA-binding LytR/AlgR family response regulator